VFAGLAAAVSAVGVGPRSFSDIYCFVALLLMDRIAQTTVMGATRARGWEPQRSLLLFATNPLGWWGLGGAVDPPSRLRAIHACKVQTGHRPVRVTGTDSAALLHVTQTEA